jgi:hypothetical protein
MMAKRHSVEYEDNVSKAGAERENDENKFDILYRSTVSKVALMCCLERHASRKSW